MYKIYLLQQNGGNVILIDNKYIIEATVDRKINTADTFSMTWTGEGFTGTLQAFTFGIMVKDQDNEIIFGGRIISTERDIYGLYHVEAEGALAYLNDYVVGPYEVTKANGWNTSKRVKGIYNYVLNAYSAVASAGTSTWNFLDMQASYCAVDNSSLLAGASSKDYQSCLECIKSLLVDTCGLILDVRYTAYNGEFIPKLYVRSSNYSTSSTQELKLGENILDVKFTTDYSEVCTRVFAFGAQKENSDKRLTLLDAGQTYKSITDTTARNKYGLIAKTVIFENVTNPTTLLNKAQDYLDAHKVPKTTIEISAVDLHLADSSINKFHLYDKVELDVATQNYSGTVQIKALHYDLVNVERSAITCESSFIQSTTALQARITKALNAISDSGYNSVINNNAIADTVIKKLQGVAITTSGDAATITFAQTDPSTGEALTDPLTITAQKVVDNSEMENGAYVVKQGTTYYKVDVPTLTEEQLEAIQGVAIEAEVLGTKIVAETIEADTLKVTQAFANKIFAENITAKGTITGATLKGASVETSSEENGIIRTTTNTNGRFEASTNKVDAQGLITEYSGANTTDGQLYLLRYANGTAGRGAFVRLLCKLDGASLEVAPMFAGGTYPLELLVSHLILGNDNYLNWKKPDGTVANIMRLDANGNMLIGNGSTPLNINGSEITFKSVNINDLLVIEEVVKDNIAVTHNSYTDITISASKTNYTPIAIGQTRIYNASTSGSGGAFVVQAYAWLNGNTLTARLTNVKTGTSQDANVQYHAWVLYKRTI